MNVTERQILKELREHPWASKDVARRIAEDHAKRKTTTREGKRIYMRDYMRQKRQMGIPSLSDVIGLQLPKRRRQ